MKKIQKSILMLLVLSFAFHNINAQTSNNRPLAATDFKIDFGNSVYCDFLDYLFYRQTKSFKKLDSIVNIQDVPPYKWAPAFLPEMVNTLQVKGFANIRKLLIPYKNAKTNVLTTPQLIALSNGTPVPDYDSLLTLINTGEKHFKSFEKYWHDSINPRELSNIAILKKQNDSLDITGKYFALTRMHPKFNHLFAGIEALHYTGTGLLNPPGIHSPLFGNPDFAWFLGHELTHLVFGEFTGANWKADGSFAPVMKYLKDKDISYYEVEEALCLFNQVKLSQICGLTKPDFKVSKYLPDNLFRKHVLQELEENYDQYAADKKTFPTELDYLRYCALKAIDKNK